MLTARAEAVAPGDPDALDLFSLDIASVIVRSDPEREYLLLADGAYRMRFELRGDSVAAGAVRLHYDIAGFRDVRSKIPLLERIDALGRHARLPPALFPPDPIADRRRRAFDAWLSRRDGASQIEIAIALFGDDAVDATSVDYMRKRVARLLELADRRIAIGYHRFFGG